jgi:threonine/homoserine/homoserine lactone efflux protein
MPFDVNTIPNILDIVFKGLLIGIIASAPMGPVGVLCVQRTLNKGRWYGFVTGCGAALSDMIYAGITGLGMGLVVDFVSNDTNRFYLQIAGSIMLLAFGWYTYRTDPTRKLRKPGQNKGTLTHNAITAFFVTLSNPLIIFLFMALYAQFAFGLQPDRPIEMIAGFLSIIGGALLWWWGLTWLIDKIRTKFDTNGIRLINQIIGMVVMLGSVIILMTTLFSLHLYNIF